MLYKDPFIIAPKTFELIQILQSNPTLEGFYLVGGTSLALQIGHRNSIDIDLFTQQEFDTAELLDNLTQKHQIEVTYLRPNTMLSVIDEVKTDFIRHNYNFVNQPITQEGITFLSKEDIAAMKLNAIVNSGQRLKDFIDVYFLLEYFSMNEILGFFTTKYPNYNPLIALKALNYFGDIDASIDPPKLKKKISIANIQKRIEQATLHTYKVFPKTKF
jgi:hypothetical protein